METKLTALKNGFYLLEYPNYGTPEYNKVPLKDFIFQLNKVEFLYMMADNTTCKGIIAGELYEINIDAYNLLKAELEL